jgi:hypothetical protein
VADYVIDTNVWVMVDKVIDVSKASKEEVACIEACRDWLRRFEASDDRLIVDDFASRKILNEYRRSIGQRGRARDLLNRLERLPRERILDVDIAFDADGYAVVPPDLMVVDKDDRKFVAVALAHQPTPPIVDATDTDWEQARELLLRHGIVVQELCPEYIQKIMAGKGV